MEWGGVMLPSISRKMSKCVAQYLVALAISSSVYRSPRISAASNPSFPMIQAMRKMPTGMIAPAVPLPTPMALITLSENLFLHLK